MTCRVARKTRSARKFALLLYLRSEKLEGRRRVSHRQLARIEFICILRADRAIVQALVTVRGTVACM